MNIKNLLICAFILLMTSKGFAQLSIGNTLPMADKKMKDVKGKEVSLSAGAGKNGLLVMFSSNACPYVLKYNDRACEASKLAMDNSIGVIFINSNEAQRDEDDSYKEMKKYASKNKYNWPYTLDENSEIANAFGANRTPECFLFNKDMVLVYHGGIDDNASNKEAVTRHHLTSALHELIEGKEISMKETKSLGCTIKRKS